jgi:hypothetical protein
MKDSQLDGMTLNERLFVTGLREMFDAAVKRRDREAIIGILSEVAVQDVGRTADAILASRHRSGG